MAFKTFCGITCGPEGKGWEGVESRVGSGDHVRVWLQHVATCLWSSGLGGGWAVYIHLVPSIVRSRHERWLFSQSREQRRPMGGGDSGLFQWLFPATRVTKGGSRFPILGGYLSYMWHISNPISLCLPIKFCSPFWQAKNMPLLVIAANEVTNEQKVTSKKKWVTSRRVVRRKYPERFRKNRKRVDSRQVIPTE